MTNKYQVMARRGTLGDSLAARRIPLCGALFGGGIPLLATALSYWAGGWGTLCILLLLGAGVGVVVGYRSARRGVASMSPVRTSFGVALVAALLGTTVIVTFESVAVVAVGGGLYWLPFVVVAGIPVGLITGMAMSSPVALISVFLVRRIAQKPSVGSRDNHVDGARA